jgi:hypothetical protein
MDYYVLIIDLPLIFTHIETNLNFRFMAEIKRDRPRIVDFLHGCGDGMGRLSWSMRFMAGDKRIERFIASNQKVEKFW